MNKRAEGFSLLEVLAALILTTLFVFFARQALSLARSRDQVPAEVMRATSRAEVLLAEAELRSLPTPTRSGEDLRVSPLRIRSLGASLAPPVASSVASVAHAEPPLKLNMIRVLVTLPSGRRTEIDGVASRR